MSSPALISVVIPNYNGREFIEPCLQSVLAQKEEASIFEVIVVDNGSQDGSVPHIRDRFPAVSLLINERNLGFTVALNQGVEIARGEWVLLLNNDTRLQPNALVTLCQALNEAPGTCAGVQPLLLRATDPELIDSAGIRLRTHFRAEDDLAGRPVAEAPGFTTEIWGACAACLLVKRSVYLSCGGFDPDYFADFDDVDFCLRARWLGYHFQLVPAARVVHHRSPTQKRAPLEQMIRHRRNHILTMIKSLPRGLRGRLLGYRLQRDLFLLLHYWRSHEIAGVLSAWSQAVCLRKVMNRRRRELLARAALTQWQMRKQIREFSRSRAL